MLFQTAPALTTLRRSAKPATQARLRLEAGGAALPHAQASVAVNSLGLFDLVQIAAPGRTCYHITMPGSFLQSPTMRLSANSNLSAVF